ncbi:MAG: PH domain-containing protein [Clostridium sp.]|nr:PH domain-containing protein [Clostridium sp.]
MDDKIKKKIIMYNMVSSIVSSMISVMIITILLFIFKGRIVNYYNIIKLGYIFLILYYLFVSFVVPFIEVRTWSYNISDKSVEYTKGMVLISKTVIPMSRIQQVTLINGPILNSFGLVKVEISTTINTHELKNISVIEGEKIVNEISQILYEKSKRNMFHDKIEGKEDEEK